MEKKALPPVASTHPGAFASREGHVRKIDVRDLLGEARELLIVHAGREYRLRVTTNGKLILTA